VISYHTHKGENSVEARTEGSVGAP
jgi:hypothetical protein